MAFAMRLSRFAAPRSMGAVRFARPTVSLMNSTPRRSFSAEPQGDQRGILGNLDHATGLEKKQLLAELEGTPLWSDDYLSGAFGTVEKPVLVPSAYDERVVGCVGGEGDSEHELLWHVVRAGEDLICAECGQVFRLVPRTEIPIMKTDML